MMSDPSTKKLILETENEYLRDQSRRMHEIDDELYYAIDEKNHQINLTEKGRDYLTPIVGDRDFFVLPDPRDEHSIIESDASLSKDEILRRKDEVNLLYSERSDRIHTVTQLLRAYSLYSKDDEYVVTDDGKVQIVDEFTGKASSRPALFRRPAPGDRSQGRGEGRSATCRRSPRSRCRTTSACTRSSPG